MGVVFSNGEDFANVRIYSGSAPGLEYHYIWLDLITRLRVMIACCNCNACAIQACSPIYI